MNRIISLFLFIFVANCLTAQYNSPIKNKVTLGRQTTADGLIWRGVAETDTLVRKPSIDTMAYMVLDTTTNIMWHYKKATSNAWLRLNLLPSDTALIAYVNTYGPQTINGAKTFSNTITAQKGKFNDTLSVGSNSSASKFSVQGSGASVGVKFTLENGGGISALNDPLGILDFYSNDPSSFSNGSFGRISVNNEFNGNWNGTQGRVNTYMSFNTAGNAILSESMRISSTGNVGIGTTSPGSRLVVKGVTNTSGESALNVTNSSNASLLFVRNDGNVGIGTATPTYKLDVFDAAGTSLAVGATTGKIFIYGDDAGGTVGLLSAIPLRFSTNGTEKMRLTATGNLGLGTVTPLDADKFGMEIRSPSDKAAYFRMAYSNLGGMQILHGGDGTGYFYLIDNKGLRFYTNNLYRMTVQDDGDLNIGFSNIDQGAYLLQVNSQIFATNATIATSDIRFKENIQPLDKGLEIINKLKPVKFNFISTTENNFSEFDEIGFIAQDVEGALSTELFAKAVVKKLNEDKDDSALGLMTEKLIPILVKAVQEQQALIKALEQRIINLENK